MRRLPLPWQELLYKKDIQSKKLLHLARDVKPSLVTMCVRSILFCCMIKDETAQEGWDAMMGTIFFTGNKRSGTSQLVRLLNLHPRLFISHESDAMWILYQFFRDEPFASHRWDSPRGMDITIGQCGHILTKAASPQENFFALQHCMMTKGNPWLPPMAKKELLWIGDKKPFQQTDPELLAFTLEMFPDARFIHMVRHPFAVAESSDRFNKTLDGDFWIDLTPEEKVAKWTFHEKTVEELKRSQKTRVIDVRYEDLCKEPARELTRIFCFLDLDIDKDLLKKAQRDTHVVVKNVPAVPCTKETTAMMERYGYKPQGIKKTRLKLKVTNTYWRLRRSLGY
jgi:hypothetical protein